MTGPGVITTRSVAIKKAARRCPSMLYPLVDQGSSYYPLWTTIADCCLGVACVSCVFAIGSEVGSEIHRRRCPSIRHCAGELPYDLGIFQHACLNIGSLA